MQIGKNLPCRLYNWEVQRIHRNHCNTTWINVTASIQIVFQVSTEKTECITAKTIHHPVANFLTSSIVHRSVHISVISVTSSRSNDISIDCIESRQSVRAENCTL